MSSTDSSSLSGILSSLSGPTLLSRGSEQYEESNNSYYTLFESAIKPAHIVQPHTALEVSNLIKALRPLLLRGDLKIAVKGTGHTPWAGSANIDNGITIDLSQIKGISLNEDQSVVSIGIGETWTTVYTKLEEHNLTTAGGRDAKVGVGGLVLGGGLSFYSSTRGFACDSVVDFEVVLASGEIVHANAQENSDLFVSLKGGLNNFGIVTALKMTTFKPDPVWGGITYYLPGTYEKLMQAVCDFVETESDEDTLVMASTGYAFGHQVVVCCLYHLKGIENPPSLQKFTALEPQIKDMCTMRTSTQIGFGEEFSKFSPCGVRSFYSTCTIRPDPELMNLFHQKWQATVDALKEVDGLIFTFGFQMVTKSLLRASAAAGGNAFDLDPADGPLLIVLIGPTWKSAEDDDRVMKAVADLLVELKQAARERGLLHRYVFTNYAYVGEDVFAGYGEKSLKRLRETSKKYDPEGVFQTAVPGGFKVSYSG